MATKRIEPGYKRCPRCAEDVKAAAVVCKHCHYEFTAEDNARQAAIEKQTKRNGAIGIGVLVALGLLVFRCGSGEADQSTNAAAETIARVGGETKMQELLARASAGAILKERLNDPDSFDLVDAQAMPAKTKDGSPGWAVGVTYRAKNGFGGVVTRNAVVSVDQSGNHPLDVVDVDPAPRHHR